MSSATIEPLQTPFGWELRRGDATIARQAAAYPTQEAAAAALRSAYLAVTDPSGLATYVTYGAGGSCVTERLPVRVVLHGWTPAEREALAALPALGASNRERI